MGKFNEKLSIYYCLDDFPSEIANDRRENVIRSLERRLLTRSDIVFACTRSLFEERKNIRTDVIFIRNGVNVGSFGYSANSDDAASDISDIRSPRIGLIGTFDSRIDTTLVFFIAKQRPQWQIVLVGSNMRNGFNIREFKKYPNMHNLGFKENKLLPRYINAMDVCIIPYHTEGFNRYIFPMKILEYLAAGKPVVSTYLPELEEFREVIKLSNERNDFLGNIESLLSADSREMAKRREAVLAMSWEGRVDEICGIVATFLKKKGKRD